MHLIPEKQSRGTIEARPEPDLKKRWNNKG